MKIKEKLINAAEDTKKDKMFKDQIGMELTDEQLSSVAAGFRDIEIILSPNHEAKSVYSNS